MTPPRRVHLAQALADPSTATALLTLLGPGIAPAHEALRLSR